MPTSRINKVLDGLKNAIWDAQKDMFMDVCDAVITAIIYALTHMKDKIIPLKLDGQSISENKI